MNEMVIGGFGCSIGTDIMLESLFTPTGSRIDKDRKVPNDIRIDNFEKHYFNIYTIARNCLHAHTDNATRSAIVNDSTLMDIVINEINIIASLYSDTKCKPVLFAPGKAYDVVMKKMNIENHTMNNKLLVLMNYVNHFIKSKKYDIAMDVVANTYKLPPSSKNTLITTHISVDLLNINKVINLALLESHTGKYKDKKLFYTKYHKLGTNTLTIFPYIEELVYILGERTIVLPKKLKLRRKLYNLAIEKKWTQYTGRIKILADMNKDDELKEFINGYKRLYI
jgi:hypothetical protein